MPHKTTVSIEDEGFLINGEPTYAGRSYRGCRIEGLLMNSRMVQGTFDDLNPATVGKWAYPDTGVWDPERNVREFLAAMPLWREHGLLAITLNLQGGSPEGYSRQQPWHNSGWTPDGELRADYRQRTQRILDRADDLGMVVILGLFYFGQDGRLKSEDAIKRAVDEACRWLLANEYGNVLVEINNECDVAYGEHAVLQPARVHELIERARNISSEGKRLLVGTSYGGGRVPDNSVAAASDFMLLHGNGVEDPRRIAEMVRQTRALESYRPMPILFNEDDHFHFEEASNNMLAAVSEYASWGYFDPGESNYRDGYQSVPVNWGINTERKRSFFRLLRAVAGE